jgi:serine/threonine-protein kinase HipA
MTRPGEEPLHVSMDGRKVGVLRRILTKEMGFHYDDGWLSFAQAIPLSRALPLREEEYRGAEVARYFDNLLPENRETRQRLARACRIDSADVFDLLRALGKDCVGALQLTPATSPLPKPLTARGVLLSESDIAQRLRELESFPLGIHGDSDFRLSLAGVQDKTALLQMNGNWYLPTGSTPTTHLFKPPIGYKPGGMGFPYSIENEWFCLHLLERMGLRVAKTGIHVFQDVRSLIVERFDRFWKGQVLCRKPMEDLCQAFGLPSDRKYESDGGPGLVSIFELLDESNERERDRQEFFRSQVLFWLLGAVDGHAKNFSLLWDSSGFELAPLYDVLSADPLVAAGQVKRKAMKLSMAVGDHRHYRLDEITGRHWRETGQAARLPALMIEGTLGDLKKSLPVALNKAIQERPRMFPSAVYEPIATAATLRLRRL